MKTKMPVEISVKVLAFGITDRLIKLNDLRILRRHIHQQIRRNAITLIRDPFDQARISKRCDADRSSIIVDLRIFVIHFKLRYHVDHGAHFALAKDGC